MPGHTRAASLVQNEESRQQTLSSKLQKLNFGGLGWLVSVMGAFRVLDQRQTVGVILQNPPICFPATLARITPQAMPHMSGKYRARPGIGPHKRDWVT
jgi:hypothetical protein